MTSYLRSICTPYFHRRHWIYMSVMAKNASPNVTLPAGADSHLRCSSLISGAAFADVDALTISPTALTTSHAAAAASAAAIVSKVSLTVLSSHHRIIYSMNSYYSSIIRVHTPTLTYKFISFINVVHGMNSFSPSIIWIHILREWYEFIFISIIWIHIFLQWYEFIFFVHISNEFVYSSQSPLRWQFLQMA